MAEILTLTLVDGARVVVPDSLALITPYVLQEQLDWFEDEIKFLRRVLRPGDCVIDIGANYGVYALSMAKAVGPAGRVWAYEPASTTADFLARGIVANGFSNVVLERVALSNRSGTAQLTQNANAELNHLVDAGESGGSTETVNLSTLDESMVRHAWNEIAFVKIDAEGAETDIVAGGGRFFAVHSPLVQYEIKDSASWHMELVRIFAHLGYDSYRLVPGLDVLVPFDPDATPDGYLLNLFCCKADRAQALATAGHLVGMDQQVSAAGEIADRGPYHWRKQLSRLQYGTQFAMQWELAMRRHDASADLVTALASHAISRDATLSAGRRFAALEESFTVLAKLCERNAGNLRLASLARVACDYGARSVAVNALQRVINNILGQRRVELGEPFLAPCARFDRIPPGKNAGDWVLAAALEEFERLASYSSFYAGEGARQRLEMIRSLGYGDAAMNRRMQLFQRRLSSSG